MSDREITTWPALGAAGLAALLAAALAPTADAADPSTQTGTVVVSASRLDAGLPGASTTVIEAADIEASTAENLPELLGLEAGIQARDLFGATAGANATVDMRGFGAPATANVLILLDGRRLNDIDLGGVDFATIPLDSIQRIEIIRGNAGAVLYGDGAMGGVINIVTKPLAGAAESVRGEVAFGSLGVREGSASATQRFGDFTLYGNATNRHSNGYRENNSLDEKTLTGELRHSGARGDAFVKFGLDDQSAGLPGARRVTTTTSLVATNPKGATTPFDEASQQGVFATLGATRQIGDNVNLIVDGGVRLKDQEAYIVSAFGPAFNSYLATSLITWSLTPRATVDFDLGGMPGSGTVGLDYYFSDYESNRQRNQLVRPIHVYDTRQHSAGLYAQGSLAVTPDTDVSAGARLQGTDLRFRDTFDPTAPSAFGSGAPAIDDRETHHAANIGVEHRPADRLALFARAARSFRLPTVDERTAAAGGTGLLRTQTSWDAEAGTRFGAGPVDAQISTFVMETRNEIRFDPTLGGGFGANTNTDPLRRIGVEAAATVPVGGRVRVKGNLTFTDARFIEGTFSGKPVPLVSKWAAAASVFVDVVQDVTVAVTGRYFSDKSMENDEANNQPRIPGYMLLDAKATARIGKLRVSAEAHNLTDRKYFNYAVASTTTIGTYNAYPLPGRTFLLRAVGAF